MFNQDILLSKMHYIAFDEDLFHQWLVWKWSSNSLRTLLGWLTSISCRTIWTMEYGPLCSMIYVWDIVMFYNYVKKVKRVNTKSAHKSCWHRLYTPLFWGHVASCRETFLQRSSGAPVSVCAASWRVHPGLQRLELSGSISVAINPCTVGRVQTL